MLFRPATRRRIAWALVILSILVVLVIGILSFADVNTLPGKERCVDIFRHTKWPMYIGCAMTAHEDLAGGVLAAAGALFAAWLAFDAVQEQLFEERERRRQQQADAKQTAVICITQPVHAAAATLFAIDRAIAEKHLARRALTDEVVRRGIIQLGATLKSFAVSEAYRDLGLDDRILYLAIIGTLTTFTNIASEEPSSFDRRENRLQNHRATLLNLHTYLADFDEELATVYARDSQTSRRPSTS